MTSAAPTDERFYHPRLFCAFEWTPKAFAEKLDRKMLRGRVVVRYLADAVVAAILQVVFTSRCVFCRTELSF